MLLIVQMASLVRSVWVKRNRGSTYFRLALHSLTYVFFKGSLSARSTPSGSTALLSWEGE